MTVHQRVPTAHRGDAGGGRALVIQSLLRAKGRDAAIDALEINPDLTDAARPCRGAGVPFIPNDFSHTAGPLRLMALDDSVRTPVAERQRRRLAPFVTARAGTALRRLLERFQ